MNPISFRHFVLRACFVAAIFNFFQTPRASAIVDLDSDGESDVWALVFKAEGLPPSADADGDGVSNLNESVAGTNPFDGASRVEVKAISLSGTNLSMTWPSVFGKSYQIQGATVPNGTWTNIGVPMNGTGTDLNSVFDPGTAQFFHVVVSDLDSDGDGLSDWEEIALGLNPYAADSRGDGMTDYNFVANALVSVNVVTNQASSPLASEDGPTPGIFTVKRTGNLNAITVNYTVAGTATAGSDYVPLSGVVTLGIGVNSATISVMPMPDSLAETGESVVATLLPDSSYTLGAFAAATVIINPGTTPSGTGLTGQYYDNGSVVYTSGTNFTALKVTRTDGPIDFNWGLGSPDPSMQPTLFTVRWTGQVQPEYSEEYTFSVKNDDGVKLWVNGQTVPLIDSWATNNSATERTGRVTLQAGVRYDIKLEYVQNTSTAEMHLSWYSPSQAKQIIPAIRLYPSSGSTAPVAVTSATDASAVVGGPFSYQVTASNDATSFTFRTPGGGAADGQGNTLPPGLSYNAGTGLITGVPTVAGDYEITITASKTGSTGTSVLVLHVTDTGSAITRDVWSSVSGSSVGNIPTDSVPTVSGTLSTLEEVADSGTAYGTRIRGYITVPTTGNYYFWIAGSNTAELWISNDSEPVNKVKRAYVAAGTASQEWTKESKQKSPWLAMVAGKKYYIEILHNTGAGSHNLAVGWLKAGQTGTVPSEVVPGYALSPYVAPPAASNPGTLYVATMLAQGTAVSKGVGTATLRVSADQTKAVLVRTYGNLSGPITAEHIHIDPYKGHPSAIVFDIDLAGPQPDGSYVWNIGPSGTFTTAAEILDAIKEGAAYINLHTAVYGAGEIRGNFTLAAGSRTFTPPPAPPDWTSDAASANTNANAAARFLTQATFGPSQADIAALQAMPSYDAWIEAQFSQPITPFLPIVLANVSGDPVNAYTNAIFQSIWWQQVMTAPDQLRQRVAFALSETIVVSTATVLNDNVRAIGLFYDTLLNNAFGNARNLIKGITLTPTMGRYLDMLGNDKPDLPSGRHPNENYAREIMQLFSIGLYRMWPDGSLVLTSKDEVIPTYDQNSIIGVAHVFTGWTYNQANVGSFLPTSFNPAANWVLPMKEVPSHHFTGTKQIFDNVVLPGLPILSGTTLDPYATHTTAQINDPAYQALPAQELDIAHEALFNHPNFGPFLCRQLIQRLVTSNPTPGYIYRVVQKFNDNGSGVRGDMMAVVKAILLDYEARGSALPNEPRFGKQREPLLRVTGAARAFPAPANLSGTYSENGDRKITITTPTPHRLTNNTSVALQFNGSLAPTNTTYTATVMDANTFTVDSTGMLGGTYSQSGNTITITSTGHKLIAGNPVFLKFTSGGAPDAQYFVLPGYTANTFSVTSTDSATRSGNAILVYYTGGNAQTGTSVLFSTKGNHNLNVGDYFYVDIMLGTTPDGLYQVLTVPDVDHFTATVGTSSTQTQNRIVIAPLIAPPLVRSGTVSVGVSTWGMGDTDADIVQTPLKSPTVFNFFLPDYQFPGSLASAGLTTPEFQLTSDTNVMLQTNFLTNGILYPTGNTSGISSFKKGSNTVVMDLSPWMSQTADSSIPALVDELSSILTAGQIPSAAKTIIVNYVTGPATPTKNFPINVPFTSATDTQKRDRVRAIVQLLITSPDYTIQK